MIPDDHILKEPCRRSTAPCIAYAAWKIKKIDPNANMVVTPSDHFVADVEEFRRVTRSSLDFVKNSDAILTIGIKPTRPEVGYGYIEADLSYPSNYNKEVFRVDSFKEKPDLATAENFMHIYGKKVWKSLRTKEAEFYLPTHSPAKKQPTKYITYYIYGNNWALSKNVTNYT